MGTRDLRVAKLPFGFIAVAMFVVVLTLVCIEMLSVGGSVREATFSPPTSLVLRRHQYPDYAHYHDDLLFGDGVGELRIQAEAKNKCYVLYGGNWAECRYNEVVFESHAALYTAKPTSRDIPWTAYLRLPLGRGADGITGYWAFCMKENDDEWAGSEWLMLNDDGTAIWGSGDYDATEYDEQNLPPEGNTCTWRSVPREDGVLIILDLEQGYSAVEVML